MIAVITITCRPNPRFLEIYRGIASSLREAAGAAPAPLPWIVVDDKLRTEGDRRRRHLAAEVTDPAIELHHLPPRPSEARAARLPHHNVARNTGLGVALELGASYVVFVDDCTVITRSTIPVVLEVASRRFGLRGQLRQVDDMEISPAGTARFEQRDDPLVRVAPMTVAGGCFGAPLAELAAIGGFDEAYVGAGFNDIEAFVRLQRAGVPWRGTFRFAAIQLRATHDAESVSRDPAHRGRGARSVNRRRFAALLRDRSRIAAERPGIGAARPPLGRVTNPEP